MDLIYTNAARVDQGVLPAYSFDLSFGASENNFELTIGKDEAVLEPGAVIYIEGTEYGGMVDGVKTSTTAESVTYFGRTWHGIMNSKVIQPQPGEDYYIMPGIAIIDANDMVAAFIGELGLDGLFSIKKSPSGILIGSYKMPRYCKGYDGIRGMLAEYSAKLQIEWREKTVFLEAVPRVDYSENPVDGDIAPMYIERHEARVNHLICLGRGELKERELIHLYIDQFGRIGDTKYFTGLDEVVEVYDYPTAESSEELRKGGIKRLKELRNNDRAELDLIETDGQTYDIGDIVGATDVYTGISVATAVTQKIIRIRNGVISTEYRTGG